MVGYLSFVLKYVLKLAGKSNTKKRTYSEDYLKFGFTSIISGGIEKPQCVICFKVLSAESMKPFQLKRHFEKEHSDCKDRDISFFQRKVDTVKRTMLDATGDFHSSSKSALEASYCIITDCKNKETPYNRRRINTSMYKSHCTPYDWN